MKSATTVLVLGAVFALSPISANSDAIRRLLNKIESFKDHSWIGAELQDVAAARRRSLRLDDTTSTYSGVRKGGGGGGTRQLKKGKFEKNGKSVKDPESCCDFLATLSARDMSCFNIVRKAEIVNISQDETYDCAEDLDKAKKAKKNSDDNLLPLLADQYEDASEEYIDFIEAALDGEFDNVVSSCFDSTPSTFTFACEPGVATVTDDEALFEGVDASNFDEFYSIPDVLGGDDAIDDEVVEPVSSPTNTPDVAAPTDTPA